MRITNESSHKVFRRSRGGAFSPPPEEPQLPPRTAHVLLQVTRVGVEFYVSNHSQRDSPPKAECEPRANACLERRAAAGGPV